MFLVTKVTSALLDAYNEILLFTKQKSAFKLMKALKIISIY